MVLSRTAQEHADEIRSHDWSDAPFRLDRAGHQRSNDRKSVDAPLSETETDAVRMNVIWVTAQVLLHADKNFNPWEFAKEAGAPHRFLYRTDGSKNGMIMQGLRVDWDEPSRTYIPRAPGQLDY